MYSSHFLGSQKLNHHVCMTFTSSEFAVGLVVFVTCVKIDSPCYFRF